STQAVGKVRFLFAAAKAGHAGTLDPLATGILPIALGEATKAVPQVQDGTKIYRFAIAWGAATSTDDAAGEIVATPESRPERAAAAATRARPATRGGGPPRPPRSPRRPPPPPPAPTGRARRARPAGPARGRRRPGPPAGCPARRGRASPAAAPGGRGNRCRRG